MCLPHRAANPMVKYVKLLNLILRANTWVRPYKSSRWDKGPVPLSQPMGLVRLHY